MDVPEMYTTRTPQNPLDALGVSDETLEKFNWFILLDHTQGVVTRTLTQNKPT